MKLHRNIPPELINGSNADAMHVHSIAGLQDAVQDLLPNLLITAGDQIGTARTITVQARDAANNNLAERCLVRVWLATSNYGAPSATGNTVGVDTGTTYKTEITDAALQIISNANGTVAIYVEVMGGDRYIMAEIDGRIYSSGKVTW